MRDEDDAHAWVRRAVFDEIEMVALEQARTIGPLADSLSIEASGLDSLCMAILILRLEDRLALFPFDDGDFDLPVTLGDLVAAYARCQERQPLVAVA